MLRLLGLARRAGGLVPGVDAARQTVESGDARLVVVAEDASPAQLRKVTGLAVARGVPLRIVADRARLGQAVGLPLASAMAIKTEGIAEELLRRLPAP